MYVRQQTVTMVARSSQLDPRLCENGLSSSDSHSMIRAQFAGNRMMRFVERLTMGRASCLRIACEIGFWWIDVFVDEADLGDLPRT